MIIKVYKNNLNDEFKVEMSENNLAKLIILNESNIM